jgi:hypothetical protein
MSEKEKYDWIRFSIGCQEYREFSRWVQKRFPNLFTTTDMGLIFLKEPPLLTTPADMDEAIILISEKYARRRRAMSSPHSFKQCGDAFGCCIHSCFQELLTGIVWSKEAMRERPLVYPRNPPGLVGEAEALRREVNALREAEAALRKKLSDKDKAKDKVEEYYAAQVTALREKVGKTEKALRAKVEEAEQAERVIDRILGRTPQQPPDASPPREPKYDPRAPYKLPDGKIPDADYLKPYQPPTHPGETWWQIQKKGGDVGGD